MWRNRGRMDQNLRRGDQRQGQRGRISTTPGGRT